MKLLGMAGAAALSTVLAMASLTYAQDQKPEQPKPEAKPAEQAKPAKPAAQPKMDHPERNDRAQAEQQKAEQKDAAKQEEKEQKQAADQQKQADKMQKQNDERAQNQKAQKDQEKQAAQDRKQQEKLQKQQAEQQAKQSARPERNAPAPQAQAANVRGGGEHIPDNKFRAHFGREHHFHVNRPVVVEGEPRFQYAGFWFVMVDPWPAAWSYDDDVYIDYIDGMYYLCDPVHPGIEIQINVVG